MAPAITAVHFDNVAMLALLIDHGADPFCSPHPVSICAHPLSSPRPVSTVRLTTGRYTTGVRDSIFDTACRDGRLACVRYLLTRLVQQPRDQTRDYPVEAAANIDRKTVKKLLYRAMVAAVEQNQADVVGVLLDVGADANANYDNDIGRLLSLASLLHGRKFVFEFKIYINLKLRFPSHRCKIQGKQVVQAILYFSKITIRTISLKKRVRKMVYRTYYQKFGT